jgi:hypothetical protein
LICSLTERKPRITNTENKTEEYFVGEIAKFKLSYFINRTIPSRTEIKKQMTKAGRIRGRIPLNETILLPNLSSRIPIHNPISKKIIHE